MTLLAALATALLAVVAATAVVTTTRLRRSRTNLRVAMVGIADALGQGDRDALLDVVVRAAARLAAADVAVLWAMAGGGLQARASTDPTLVGGRRDRGEGAAGRAAASGRAEVDQGGSGDPELAVPVIASGRTLGALSVRRRRGGVARAVLGDLEALACQAGAALASMNLHDEARRLSLTDGLTGLWNRRQFDLRASQELERTTRFGERFAIVLVDLDGFKQVNDIYGHPTGDAVLVEVAQRLVDSTREVDLVARFGGEEFVLLLPQTDPEGAMRVAEKVRAEVAATPVDTDAGPLAVSLSAGVACHPDHGGSTVELLAAADVALYDAKQAGKNRVVVATSLSATERPPAAPKP